MNRRDFVKNTGLLGLLIPICTLVKGVGKFGLVDAGKDVGPHRHTCAVLNGKRCVYLKGSSKPHQQPVTAANDIEGWIETLNLVPGQNVCGFERTRHYGAVEIKWIRDNA